MRPPLFGHLVACVAGVALATSAPCLARETTQAGKGDFSEVLKAFEQYAREHPKGDVAFTWDQEAYLPQKNSDLSELPIGVFDSGIGGLTVLESLLTLDLFNNHTARPEPDGIPDLAAERFVYLGDQANMPYGNYPAKDREGFLHELILKDVAFLLGTRFHLSKADGGTEVRRTKSPVKAVVIACNTATAYGLEDIRSLLARMKLPLPVVGVVEAGAVGVKNARGTGAVGILATIGTCLSGVYPKTISRMLATESASSALSQWGSADLAAVIEGDRSVSKSVSSQALLDVKALVDSHRNQQLAISNTPVPLQKIVLGCTHFPLVTAEIDAAFDQLRALPEYVEWIASRRVYVNPAEWTARQVFTELSDAHLRRSASRVNGRDLDPSPEVQFFLSVPNEDCPRTKISAPRVFDTAYKYGRHPGNLEVEDVFVMPFGRSQLPENTATLVREKLPRTWRLLPD